MHWNWNGWSGWNWTLMTLGMVAFWGLVIWAVGTFLRSPNRSPRDGLDVRSAEQILAERLAAGEIDADDYHQRLTALRANEVPADKRASKASK